MSDDSFPDDAIAKPFEDGETERWVPVKVMHGTVYHWTLSRFVPGSAEPVEQLPEIRSVRPSRDEFVKYLGQKIDKAVAEDYSERAQIY